MPSDPVDPATLFQCRMCGACCQGYGGTYVTAEDMAGIAAFIGEDADTFAERYCRRSGNRYVLAQSDEGFCVFWRDGRCGIHPVKPRMCRAWPFIESVVRDPSNWRIMAGFCPGMRADADPETVRACVAAVMEKNR